MPWQTSRRLHRHINEMGHHLIVPSQTVKAKTAASWISALNIEIVDIKAGQFSSRVVHNTCGNKSSSEVL